MRFDYDDFLDYTVEHEDEIRREVVSHFKNAYNENLTLSQADIQLIAEISVQTNYAILRQYHEWLKSQN